MKAKSKALKKKTRPAKKPALKIKHARKSRVKAKPESEHFVRVSFGVLEDNRPEIYAFFYKYLPVILEKMGEEKAGLKIERLEPLDSLHVNLPLKSKDKILHALSRFTLSHALHRHRNVLTAMLPVKRLSHTLKDYDILFDLFFTDITIAARKFKVEMMDGFYNSLLLSGERKHLEKVMHLTGSLCRKKPNFKFVDHSERK